jgi:hypothetical protein
MKHDRLFHFLCAFAPLREVLLRFEKMPHAKPPSRQVLSALSASLCGFLLAVAAPAQITNYPAGLHAVMVNTNGVLVAPAGFLVSNSIPTKAGVTNQVEAATNAVAWWVTNIAAAKAAATTGALGAAAWRGTNALHQVLTMEEEASGLEAPEFLVTKDVDGTVAAMGKKTPLEAATLLGVIATSNAVVAAQTTNATQTANIAFVSNRAERTYRYVDLYVNNATIQNNIAGASTNWLTHVHNFNAYAGGWFFATGENKTGMVRSVQVYMATTETPVIWFVSRHMDTLALATQKCTLAVAPTGGSNAKLWTNNLAFPLGTNSMLEVRLERVAGGNYAIWSPVTVEIEVGP